MCFGRTSTTATIDIINCGYCWHVSVCGLVPLVLAHKLLQADLALNFILLDPTLSPWHQLWAGSGDSKQARLAFVWLVHLLEDVLHLLSVITLHCCISPGTSVYYHNMATNHSQLDSTVEYCVWKLTIVGTNDITNW